MNPAGRPAGLPTPITCFACGPDHAHHPDELLHGDPAHHQTRPTRLGERGVDPRQGEVVSIVAAVVPGAP